MARWRREATVTDTRMAVIHTREKKLDPDLTILDKIRTISNIHRALPRNQVGSDRAFHTY